MPAWALDSIASCEDLSVMSESDPLPVSLDVNGAVHYHVPPSLSPKSFVTATLPKLSSRKNSNMSLVI